MFNSTLTANSSDSPDVVNSGNQWATFLLGALDGQTSARLVPLQTLDSRGLRRLLPGRLPRQRPPDAEHGPALGVRAGRDRRREPPVAALRPHAADSGDAGDAADDERDGARADGEQGLQLHLQRRLGLHDARTTRTSWHITPWNFLPRFGAAYKIAERRPGGPLRLRPLPAVLQRGARHAGRLRQPVHRLRADHHDARPGQRRAAADAGESVSRPAVNPVIEPYGQAYGRYTGLGGAVSLDQYEQRPQINDRFNVSYQRRIWLGIIADVSYFFNYGSRVPYDINLNMMDPAFRYEQKTAITRQVPNPFRNYLTVDKFPGALRNTATVTHRQPARALPAVPDASRRPTPTARNVKTHTLELRAQRPFVKGLSFVASYAYNYEQRQEWFDDLAQYKVLTRGGKDGWKWRPTADVPAHRFTGAVTWQIPVGKDRAFGSDHADGARLRGRRLAVLPGDAHVLGPAAAVHDQLRRHGQPEARQPDARPLVRHVDVLAGRHLHAAHATRTTTTASTARAGRPPT